MESLQSKKNQKTNLIFILKFIFFFLRHIFFSKRFKAKIGGFGNAIIMNLLDERAKNELIQTDLR